MRIKLSYGFLYFSLILASSINAINYENDDDYYDYEDEETTTSKPTTKFTKKITKKTTSTTQMYFPDLDDEPMIISPCPKSCTCTDGTKFIDCSNRNLTNIPQSLPEDAIKIDLSRNQLTTINESDFKKCIELRDIILANNKIKNLNSSAFQTLIHLDSLDLSSNLLNEFHDDTFKEIESLTKLVLDNNPIEISNKKSIIISEHIEDLSIKNCNITHFEDSTFEGLPNLQTLNLNDNPIELDDINEEAFKSLRKLSTLIIPNFEEEHFIKFCEILLAVDVIRSTNHNISCFELASGVSFEDSTILVKTIISTTTEANNKQKPTRNEPEILAHMPQVNSTIPKLELTVNDSKQSEELKSADFVSTILLGTIIVAVIGLVIGVICRRDVCGIKTKMCRTRRPTEVPNPTNPAEEVPLNKV